MQSLWTDHLHALVKHRKRLGYKINATNSMVEHSLRNNVKPNYGSLQETSPPTLQQML